MNRPWLSSYPPGVPADVDPSSVPTLVELIDEAAASHASRDAAVFLGRSFSYARIDRAGRQFAAWLQARGIGPGSRVAIMMPNVPQYAPAVFGILRAGATVVNVNPLYTARELGNLLADAEADAIVVLENFAATLAEVLPRVKLRHVLVAAAGDWLGPVKGRIVNFMIRKVKKAVPAWRIEAATRFDDALAEGARLAFTPPAIAPGDLAFLQYTGGTTGVSKGAMITHRNCIAATLAGQAWLGTVFEREPRLDNPTLVCALPLYHIYALVACLLLGMRVGGRLLLIPNARDIDALVRDLRRHPPHLFPAVNTLYNALLDHPQFSAIDFSRLRVANSGGMAVQRAVAERWLARTGCPIVEGWGLTESTAAATCNRVDVTTFSGTVGFPIPSCEVEVRSIEGQAVEPGTPGEIVVRGPHVMAGYWKRPDETAKALTADGWLRTGDIGVMDEKGELRIVDRMKDMILVSGFNVYPNEIEDVATMHPGVSEAAAIGVPDAKSGEAVKLFIVRKDPALGAGILARFLAERLTGYKRPRTIAFVASLPKTPVGKILRRALRDSPPPEVP
jgi:long-chain acyl-CoA synthetase